MGNEKTEAPAVEARPEENRYGLPQLPSLLTRPLGLEGWTSYEPVLLAALASEEPLLLVGPHGSAKSFLLERLAGALELDYRFYNASLINYDDLVGVPIPSADKTCLEYISTGSSIWGAQVVFIDEINRTKPELQNKLFPIINERRVQGIQLEKLRFRWSAMNPAPTADNEDASLEVYLGAEPLDPALADRFVYIIEVPGWNQLCEADRRNILADQFGESQAFPVEPVELVERTRQRLEALKGNPPPALVDYELRLGDYLHQQEIDFSTRRASMIYRNILAVHAARETLYTSACPGMSPLRVDWATSAIMAVKFSLPHVALGKAPNAMHLLGAHRQAWQLANLDALNPMHELLMIEDPVERAIQAGGLLDRLDATKVGEMMLEAVQKAPSWQLGRVNALAFYLTLCRNADAAPYVMEALAKPLSGWLEASGKHYTVSSLAPAIVERAAASINLSGATAKLFFDYLIILFGTAPALINNDDAEVAANHFARLWEGLGLSDLASEQGSEARGEVA